MEAWGTSRVWSRSAAAAAMGTVMLIVLVLGLWASGWVFEFVRFSAARIPAAAATGDIGVVGVLARGALTAVLMLAVFLAACAAAYLASLRRWDVHGQDWHDVVGQGVRKTARDPHLSDERAKRERRHAEKVSARAARVSDRLNASHLTLLARAPARVRTRADARAHGETDAEDLRKAPLGDHAVRVIAGFNVIVLAALAGTAVTHAVGPLFPVDPWAGVVRWVATALGVAVFVGLSLALTQWGPVRFPAWSHALVWGVAAVGTLFAAAPIGLLLLVGVALSTAGRMLARLDPPGSVIEAGRSPLMLALAGVLFVLGIGWSAMPPLGLPAATVRTAAGGSLTGGVVARDGDRVWMATCVGLADASSIDVALRDVTATGSAVPAAGATDYVDAGTRPSLAAIALDAFHIDVHPPTWLSLTVTGRRRTCAGVEPGASAPGVASSTIAAGAISGPAPPGGVAFDGERPIQDETNVPAGIRTLARMYEPTLLVTVADRNWPVSLDAVLAERGPAGERACLVRAGHAQRVCPATPGLLKTLLKANGATKKDYLQLPVELKNDGSPDGQFDAFLRGVGQPLRARHVWLASPGSLDPWRTAEMYFVDAGHLDFPLWQATDPGAKDLTALEYWFYYPYNYYPFVFDSGLMDADPLAGDHANVDLHQGDWEHVDVLVNSAGHPVWLYTARHDKEGRLHRWGGPGMAFDGGTHPIVQAAFGGHPSYPSGCGPGARAAFLDASSDWLSCGSGRFAFRGATTPLVDLAGLQWACWPGHFGEAGRLEAPSPSGPAVILDAPRHLIYAAGPQAPLVQAENAGLCTRGVTGPEMSGHP